MPKIAKSRVQTDEEKLLQKIMETDLNKIELEIVKKLGHATPHGRLYTVTSKHNTGSTLKALDPLVVHKFAIQSTNMMGEVKDTVSMKDLRSMDRPFYGDDCEMVGIGAIKLAIATLAEMQHWSLKDKTMVFDTLTFTFAKEITMDKITKHAKGIIKSLKPENIFDKKLLIFPTFTATGAFLTVVKNPRGILVGGKGVCVIFNIICGCERQYTKKVSDHIRTYLKAFATHFEPETRFGNADNYDFKLPSIIEQHDRPYAILGLIEKFLTAEFSFPKVKHLIDNIKDLEPRELKKELTECRMKMCDEVKSILNMKKDPLIKYVVNQHAAILMKEQQRRDNIETDVITLD